MAELTVYLLRHAKSVLGGAELADFDRPLAPRGVAEAAEVGRLFATRRIQPELIVCSTARRTRETLAGVLPSFAAGTPVALTRRVYQATAAQLLELIRGESGSARSVLLIGHNPAVEELAGLLSGFGNPDALARLAAKFPPAGLATIRFDAEHWPAIAAGAGRLEAFDTPPR